MAALHSQTGTGRRLSLNERKEIFAAHQAGQSVTSLAKRFGVSRPSVYRAIEKMGRPGQGHAEDARITIRLTPDERAALDVLSGRLGLSRAALGRRVLRMAAGFLEPDDELVEAATDLSRQIKAIGGNLNQIAAHLNREARYQGRAVPSAQQLVQIEETEKAMKALGRDVDRFFVSAARRRKAQVETILRRADSE